MYRKENETSLGCVVTVMSVEFEETTFPVNFLTVGDDIMVLKLYSSEIIPLLAMVSPETKGVSFVEITSISPADPLIAVKLTTLLVAVVFNDLDLLVCKLAILVRSVAEVSVLFARSSFNENVSVAMEGLQHHEASHIV